jgi:hypothetical protein
MGRHLHGIIRPVLMNNVAMYARKLLLGAYPCLTELVIFILKKQGGDFVCLSAQQQAYGRFLTASMHKLQKLGHCLTCY